MWDVLKIFHSCGLNDGEIFYLKTNRICYEYNGGAIKVKNSGIDEGFGIRVLKDKRLGFSYTNSLSKIPDAVKNAAALSKFSVQTSFSFPEKQKYKKIEAYDKKFDGISIKNLDEMISEILNGIKEHSEPLRIFLTLEIGKKIIANTNLVFAQSRYSSLSAYAEAKNQKGLGIEEYSHYKMPKNFRKIGENAGIMAKQTMHPKKIKTGRYSVVFSQEVLASLFDLLVSSFSGELKKRKTSKLWNKEGKKVFDERLSIYDDPFKDGEGKCAFDDEGVRTNKIPLVEKGIVKNFYYNLEISALCNLKKQGNCTRSSYAVQPGLGNSNIVVKENKKNLGKLNDYVYVESAHGLHTANPTTGNFGCEVNIAFLCKNGEKTALQNFMISENIFKLFNKIEDIEKKQIQTSDFISPRIVFKDIALIS